MSVPIRSAYYCGTREEAEAEFWLDHRRRDIIPSSFQVRLARGSTRTWYVLWRPTRSALRRWDFLSPAPDSSSGATAGGAAGESPRAPLPIEEAY